MTLVQHDKHIADEFQALCKRLEHWETPAWAAEEILRHELLTHNVLDPCCGTGVLDKAAWGAGYRCTANDIQNWGYYADLGAGCAQGAVLSALRLVGIRRSARVLGQASAEPDLRLRLARHLLAAQHSKGRTRNHDVWHEAQRHFNRACVVCLGTGHPPGTVLGRIYKQGGKNGKARLTND